MSVASGPQIIVRELTDEEQERERAIRGEYVRNRDWFLNHAEKLERRHPGCHIIVYEGGEQVLVFESLVEWYEFLRSLDEAQRDTAYSRHVPPADLYLLHG